jgi:4-hydroxythreonine-4-phosphate dehydrogenase
MSKTPRIGITLGDPSGIGPEIVAKALADDRWRNQAILQPIGPGNVSCYPPGVISAAGGAAALQAIETGVAMCRRGELDALVTGPIHKQAARLAGMQHAGHTELLAALCGVAEGDVRMLLFGLRLRVVHVSTHLALREALALVKAPRILRTIELSARPAGDRPIAVAGLNPHAGEGGLFGDEERLEIAPAVEQARARGFDIYGPLSPDTVFRQAYDGAYGLVVAMYHDQGHIPVKALEFDTAVNVTLGLPMIRTSVDHGTAMDIAGQGVARADNMIRAIEVAIELAAGLPS